MNGNRMLIAFKCLYGLNCFFRLGKQRPGLLYRNFTGGQLIRYGFYHDERVEHQKHLPHHAWFW